MISKGPSGLFRAITAAALAALLLMAPSAPRAQQSPSRQAPDQGQKVFPYQFVNYTNPAHEMRIMSAPVIVLGRVDTVEKFEGTDKLRDIAIYLDVETWFRTDRPGLENAERVYFRCLQPEAPYEPLKPGDRIIALLERDLRFDNALVLGTDFYLYNVDEDGQVRKFVKARPTLDDPVLELQPLAAFLEEIRALVRRASIEDQTYNSELVMIGTVTDSRQGGEGAEDYIYVKIAPDKVFKGDPGEGEVVFIQKANISRWALQALNRNSFKKGDRVLCFANKDPTYSRPGTWNPKGHPLWVFPYQRLSSWFVADTTTWRRGDRPILTEELIIDLEKWSKK